jgi:hypothetical protein
MRYSIPTKLHADLLHLGLPNLLVLDIGDAHHIFSEVLELQTDIELDALSTQQISYIQFSCKFFTNAGKFLSSCTIRGFSRRAQLHE